MLDGKIWPCVAIWERLLKRLPERTGIGGRLSTIDRMLVFTVLFHEKGYEQNILSLPCQTQVSNLSAVKWKLVSNHLFYDWEAMKKNPSVVRKKPNAKGEP